MIKLKKGANFTDIHWGAKNNSDQHNQDCLDYIDWFIKQVIDNDCDHIIFLGDWFENRSALNISTMNYSHEGASRLNNLNIPTFFILGNHDLYQKNSRLIYSTIGFTEFSNFQVITEPTIIEEITTSPLLCPFIFHHEYEPLMNHPSKFWFGHFEFNDFVLTGHSVLMKNGADYTKFNNQKYIFSGHYHKRQKKGNIQYIGNTFPTNHGDANDSDRGMMIFDYVTEEPIYINWEVCPKYITTSISNILDGQILPNKSRVKCLTDIALNYEEITKLKQSLTDQFNLRELQFEDIIEEIEAEESVIENNSEAVIDHMNDTIVKMLSTISVNGIDPELLIAEFLKL